jgi:FkbM family methyltransferase
MRSLKFLILKTLPDSLLFLTKRIHYVRSLRRFSEKDEPDIHIVKFIVKPGNYVIDIGANVGWYTKILSDLVGDNGRVYAIEPIPIVYDLLSSCIRNLNLRNVELLNFGISESNGSAIMEVPEYREGGENYYRASIVPNEDIKTSLKYHKIAVRSLDSMLEEMPNRIDFIKCDVEGHELEVLKGAKKLLEKCSPTWLIEVSGNPDIEGSNADSLFHILENKGYKAYWFDGVQLIKRRIGDKSINYFFLTEYHIANVIKSGARIALL